MICQKCCLSLSVLLFSVFVSTKTAKEERDQKRFFLFWIINNILSEYVFKM